MLTRLSRKYRVESEEIQSLQELESIIRATRKLIYTCSHEVRPQIENKLAQLNNIKKVENVAVEVARVLTKRAKPKITPQNRPVQFKVYAKEGKFSDVVICDTYTSMEGVRTKLRLALYPYFPHGVPRLFNGVLKAMKRAPDATPFWNQITDGQAYVEYRLEPEYARD